LESDNATEAIQEPQAQVASPAGMTLRQNFAWTLAGNIVYAGCQWGMLVALAKLGSPMMVGQFALGLAVTAPVIMFASLQLRVVQATDASREYLFGDYLGLRLFCLGLALAVICGILALSHRPVETTLVILIIGVAKLLESVSDVFYGLLQQRERMDRIGISLIIKGIVSLAALCIGIKLTGSIIWGSVSLAAVWALVLICYDIPSGALMLKARSIEIIPRDLFRGRKALLPRFEPKTMLKLAWLSLPLGVVLMLISLNTNIPRYFIEHFAGIRELGIFAAMAYLMIAGTTIVGALGQSATPRLARHYADGDIKAYRTLLMKLVCMGAAIGLVGLTVAATAGHWILTAIYKPEYASRADVFLLTAVASAICCVHALLGYGITAARYFKIQAPLLALVSTATAAACLVLIPRHGLRGAAMALIIGATIQAMGNGAATIHALSKLRKRATETA
jgi:O-antigen/teichoic acid export membrane protein